MIVKSVFALANPDILAMISGGIKRMKGLWLRFMFRLRSYRFMSSSYRIMSSLSMAFSRFSSSTQGLQDELLEREVIHSTPCRSLTVTSELSQYLQIIGVWLFSRRKPLNSDDVDDSSISIHVIVTLMLAHAAHPILYSETGSSVFVTLDSEIFVHYGVSSRLLSYIQERDMYRFCLRFQFVFFFTKVYPLLINCTTT